MAPKYKASNTPIMYQKFSQNKSSDIFLNFFCRCYACKLINERFPLSWESRGFKKLYSTKIGFFLNGFLRASLFAIITLEKMTVILDKGVGHTRKDIRSSGDSNNLVDIVNSLHWYKTITVY